MLSQITQPWWLMQHLPSMVFVFCFGACVGSFLNVVIYRVPIGMSVIEPPSRCMTCGAKLRFFRENLPIIGWFLVRGKCRYCGVKLSPQYMIIEILMALMFLGLYIVLYTIPHYTQGLGQIGGQWWYANTIIRTWPAFVALAFLLAGLVAMTVIDARTFTIPLQIPLFVTFTAFIAFPLQAILQVVLPAHATTWLQTWPMPGVGWTGFAMSIGGMIGVLVAYLLLRAGRLRYSFADYSDYLPKPDDESVSNNAVGLSTDRVSLSELVFLVPVLVGLIAGILLEVWIGIAAGLACSIVMVIVARLRGMTFGEDSQSAGDQVLAPDYPHARREVLVEVLYLGPCIIGLIAGYWIIHWAKPLGEPSMFLQSLGGTFAGYLMGGGLIWAIRILGTLGFGREAMGLGDVHLLGAIGAVVGWFDPILIFFIAPFSGLLWAFGSMGIASVFKKARRELPYGPHLAVATLVVIFCRPGIAMVWGRFMPTVPMPARQLVPGPTSQPTTTMPPATSPQQRRMP